MSVIIPVYNGAHHLLRCLRSLTETPDTRLEIVVYDDCSKDNIRELIAKCSNVKFVQGSANLGFIGAVTEAVKHATGRHLLLMNSDARLVEGSIGNAIRLLDENADWGMIGVRTELVTGRLQEAGCMIFNDGTTDGYLRSHSPQDARGLFRREVDFASGAFLFVRGHAFREMGGLDPAYAPAYYEETDLAMRFRQRGLKTIYMPDIVVQHFEFGSQPKSSAMQAIADRRKTFLQKWGHVLSTTEYGPSKSNFDCYSLRRVSAPRTMLVMEAKSGEQEPDLVKKAAASTGFLCVFLLDTKVTPATRQIWNIDPDVQLAGGSLKELQTHLAASDDFYDAFLADSAMTLETLQTLRHVKGFELLSATP